MFLKSLTFILYTEEKNWTNKQVHEVSSVLTTIRNSVFYWSIA